MRGNTGADNQGLTLKRVRAHIYIWFIVLSTNAGLKASKKLRGFKRCSTPCVCLLSGLASGPAARIGVADHFVRSLESQD